MVPPHFSQMINFLKNEMRLSSEAIQLGLKQSGSDSAILPIVLWQYGLVNLEQLDKIYDWFEVYIY
ncbi:DUF2949 domain-containing protein [Alkalinema pantanalense CENA528]|uniref:DUF2949 domain-containing protein n=1 Tax=Alkalinema pantanalense TaxID=1620705 RepID=UPI003D6E4277